MIIIKNTNTLFEKNCDLTIPSVQELTIDGKDLIALPAVIDPHVHFRVPGMEYKENWQHAAKAALQGGCTLVFDMPNTIPPTITAERLQEKKLLIEKQLQEAGIPLSYQLFFGADKNHLNEIKKVKGKCVGIKVFMGCSTGNLVIDDDESLAAVFEIAAKEKILVAVHAEDEHLIRERKSNYNGPHSYAAHSIIRNVDVATRAVAKAIDLVRRYGTSLYILHVSSKEEIALIKEAKQQGLPVFAETTPHHLFFDESAYTTLGGKAVVNPPLRDSSHREYLFAAIREKIIDTIGSDHAPHTLAEKEQAYGSCPSGMPGIEFVLPLLLNAYHAQLLGLDDICSLTSARAKQIFNIPESNDLVLVDLMQSKVVSHTNSKCNWSPYMGMKLKGWPVFTIMKGQCYDLMNDI